VLVGYQFVAIGCSIGALVFAYIASRGATGLLREAHHSFVVAV
jgi:predicted acylesterase/phospholipase RssA